MRCIVFDLKQIIKFYENDEYKDYLKDDIDYYQDHEIYKVNVFDVLSNKGLNKLIRKIYSLPKNEYEMNCSNFKKQPIRKENDYIDIYPISGWSRTLAKIVLKKDKYVHQITIQVTKINSHEVFVEYVVQFTDFINSDNYHDFITKNLKKLTYKDYYVKHDFTNDEQLYRISNELFDIIIQHYINTLFYSEIAKKEMLLNLKFTMIDGDSDLQKQMESFYQKSSSFCFYYKKDSNYLIVSSIGFNDNNNYVLSTSVKTPYISLSPYMGTYGMLFYYFVFGDREIMSFKYKYSKFFNGRVKYVKVKYLLDLYEKSNDIDNFVSEKMKKRFINDFNRSWDFYVGSEKDELDLDFKHLKKFYDQAYSFLKTYSEIHFDHSNRCISIVALIASFISLIPIIKAIIKAIIK